VDTLEEKVIDFVALKRGMRREKISLSSRLSQDLGMDGDDAVEFFERFAKEFVVDIRPLSETWGQHFGAEVGPGWSFLAVCVVFYATGAIIQHFVRWLLAWISALVFFVIWVWPMKSWPSPRRDFVPITVRDLLNSARSHYWGGRQPL
jgi:hypothetical protein